jgi:hypothetical protein
MGSTPVRQQQAQVPLVHVPRSGFVHEPTAQPLFIIERDRTASDKSTNVFAIPLAAAALEVVIEPDDGSTPSCLPGKSRTAAGTSRCWRGNRLLNPKNFNRTGLTRRELPGIGAVGEHAAYSSNSVQCSISPCASQVRFIGDPWV